MKIYGLIGIVVLIYTILILVIGIYARIDFHSRNFRSREERIYWRKRLYFLSISSGFQYLRYLLFLFKQKQNLKVR